MKVLYVVHANIWDEFSGTPLIAEQYAKEVFKKGWEACILTPSFEDLNFKKQKIKRVNNISYLSWPRLNNWNLDAFKNSTKIFNRFLIYSVALSKVTYPVLFL